MVEIYKVLFVIYVAFEIIMEMIGLVIIAVKHHTET